MTSVRRDPFVRAARVVGDFGNPFYAEERQRDVWNEASAFGLQLMLWGSVLAATVVVWTVGTPSVPYVQGALALVGTVSALTLAYAARLGIEMLQPQRMLRARLVPFTLLLLVLVAGLLRARDDGFSGSFSVGLAVGALAAVVGTALVVRRGKSSAEG